MKTLNLILAGAMLGISARTFAGDCSSLSGQYTVGKAEGADFNSIGDAVNTLKCGGVVGPVIFKLEKGVFNEQVTLGSIPGSSAYNTVTFQSASGNNADAIISYTNNDATVSLNGATNVTFENVTIDHKASTYGNCMKVDGRASNLRFKSVVFDGVETARPGANNTTIYFTPGIAKNGISFEDCEVNNGSTGITMGSPGGDTHDMKTTITGTLFFNQYEGALVLANADAPIINNNVISSLSTFDSYKAINLDGISGNMLLSNNIINVASGSIGIEMNNCVAEKTNLGQISNNSISVGGKGETYDIYLTGSTDNQVINFNRFKLALTGPETKKQAFYRNAGAGYNVNMLNNICYDLNSGGYTIIGNTYKDLFNQLPAQSNPTLTVSANGLMVEKVTPIK